MSTRGILQVEMRFAMCCQCAVHELGVAMVDNGVVFAVHKKNGAGYSVSMQLHRQRIADYLVSPPTFAQQPTPTAPMRARSRKGNDGIKCSNEVGLQRLWQIGCTAQSQMPARREAHHPYPFIAFRPNGLHGASERTKLVGILAATKQQTRVPRIAGPPPCRAKRAIGQPRCPHISCSTSSNCRQGRQ